MDKTFEYRVRIENTHNPKGPDGRGWNRMAIIGLDAIDRCALMPTTRQGALDTLRGMAKLGNPAVYSACTSNVPCHQCAIATKRRDAWRAEWHIREDSNDRVWLLGNIEKGFAGAGYCFKNWTDLMSDIEVPMLNRMRDSQGFYWVAA